MMVHRKRPFTVFAAVVLLVALPVLLTAGPADWNFTPDDYGALVKGGNDLAYDNDSDWFPQEFKDNLKATLKHVLKAGKRNTAGVNTDDFYHGHVVCPLPCTEEQTLARAALDKAAKTTNEKIPSPTKENFEKWKERVELEKKPGTDALKECLKKGCGVVYHTYEMNRPPEVGSDDPRRNLFTPNGTDPKPEEFTPVWKKGRTDLTGDDNYLGKYCRILDFYFLVDKAGKIHVVPTNGRLKAVTGL